MSDLVPANAVHVFTAFVEALANQPDRKRPTDGDNSVAASVADRVLGILATNGLMIMQVALLEPTTQAT